MIDWTDIDTVLLDMDGTLLDLHFDNYFWSQHLPRRYAERSDEPEQQARQHLTERIQSERGSLNWYCLDFWSRELALDIPALKSEIAHLIAIRPHVEQFLKQVKRSGRDCILVTNAHRDSVSLKMEHVDLQPWLDEIIISHDFDAAKEDLEFWHRMHRQYPFDPSRTLFIDDTEQVLATAETFGIRHLLTLSQPDSRQAHRQDLHYPVIHHFDEIMPPDRQENA